MIIVLFPAGAFGSTVEYCLRQFSCELTKVKATVLDNGSMHGYQKEFHPLTVDEFARNQLDYEIVTPVYPGFDYLSPLQTIQQFEQYLDHNQKVVLIYFKDLDMAQRNQLFCYHKIPILFDTIMTNKHKDWNSNYQSWHDMQIYELREALSFHIDQLQGFLEIPKQVNQNWLFVTPDDLLYNFKNTVLKIMNYLDLTQDTQHNLDDFYKIWMPRQKYILDEFDLINQITQHIESGGDLIWKKLSIMGEAIVQSRLRKMGLEIACNRLDQFPTSTQDLRKIIL